MGILFSPASSSVKIFRYPNSLFKKNMLSPNVLCRMSTEKLFGWVSGPENNRIKHSGHPSAI